MLLILRKPAWIFPRAFQQMAGLVCFYDTTNYLYLNISCDEEGYRTINLMVNDLNKFTMVTGDGIRIAQEARLSQSLCARRCGVVLLFAE
jgi:xylan 1,4-beta-xylosidase